MLGHQRKLLDGWKRSNAADTLSPQLPRCQGSAHSTGRSDDDCP